MCCTRTPLGTLSLQGTVWKGVLLDPSRTHGFLQAHWPARQDTAPGSCPAAHHGCPDFQEACCLLGSFSPQPSRCIVRHFQGLWPDTLSPDPLGCGRCGDALPLSFVGNTACALHCRVVLVGNWSSSRMSAVPPSVSC